MKERVITLGQNRNLVGVICEAEHQAGDSGRPAVLLLNAGMVHRVGPFRLNVLMARKLASAGYSSLRFDLSGIGDSETGDDSKSQDEQMISDVGLTIDYLKLAMQTEKIVVIGLCTGADNAHKAAVVYKQICGAICLDGYAFPTLKSYYHRVQPVVTSPKRLSAAIGRLIMSLIFKFKAKTGAGPENTTDEPGNLFVWQMPDKMVTAIELENLLERKFALCNIYTNGSFGTYNYSNQFRESFKQIDFGDHLTEHYFPEMDHTYILARDREKLMECVLTWLQDNFPTETQKISSK